MIKIVLLNEISLVSNGEEEIVRLLAGAGADLNVKDKDLFTPLHVAAAVGKVVGFTYYKSSFNCKIL